MEVPPTEMPSPEDHGSNGGVPSRLDDPPSTIPATRIVNTDSSTRPDYGKETSIRHHITFSERKFDTTSLPEDLQRVYKQLAARFGQDYGLIFVFTVQTAVELHRAWHMTLLTSIILQQIKDEFKMRMTWNLGVIRLKFRVEDGGFELHRKVPYDYDSEFQDLYWKIAVAFVEGHISIHEALIFQVETKQGKHTAKSGLFFLRNYPGRLLLYPLEAATCCVIFFGGDWRDAGVAAVCGVVAGLVDVTLQKIGGDATLLVDILVGFMTGIVSGLFYRFNGENYCLSSIFLGTLYWFFYGTAFVIGLLEIIAGELETGVTRFIAVSVKTFVLTMGSAVGLQVVLSQNVFDAWVEQEPFCNTIDLEDVWWRIPLYLLCSASALGQYRFPFVHYWRGLAVQLAGYEVQFQLFVYFATRHDRDFLDTAISNIVAAIAAVVTAFALSYIVDQLGRYYSAKLLHRDKGKELTRFGKFIYHLSIGYIRFTNWLGVGRKSSLDAVNMIEKLRQDADELRDPNHPRQEIKLSDEEEGVLVEALVDAQNTNIWSLLMPTVYQLVPGSLIARLWYNVIFPPPLEDSLETIPGTNFTYFDSAQSPEADTVFYGLFVISISLALGLLLGFCLVQGIAKICRFHVWVYRKSHEDMTEEEEQVEKARIKRRRFRQQSIMGVTAGDDPDRKDCVLRREATGSTLGRDRISQIRQSLRHGAALDTILEDVPADEISPSQRTSETQDDPGEH